MSEQQQEDWLENAVQNSSGLVFGLLRITLLSSGASIFMLILVPIYSVLILLYRRILVNSLFELFKSTPKDLVNEVMKETILTYHRFVKGMIIVYLVVGVLNSIGLWLLDIPNPVLFGFVAAIMTFIPYVGIIIASLLPITVAWVTHDSFWYPVGVVLVFALVQYLEANFIFPFAVSTRLRINTLATIVFIIAGGIIWGAAGMILFVPFMAMLKLVSDRMPGMSVISTLLGENTK
jgi:predicted PurR-regulated permease PerM